MRDGNPVRELIHSRLSTERFEPGSSLSEEEIRELVDDAVQAPSSFNIQHWRFVVVRDPELRNEIRAHGNDQAQMTDASVLIVMTADVLAWKKDPARYWRNAPKEVADLLVGWMGPFHQGKEQLHAQLVEAATDPDRLLALDRELKAVVAEREAVEADWLEAAELAES